MEVRQQDPLFRARLGVLKFVSDRGGSAQLSDIHEFSGKKYFIMHQGFSRLMESVVSEGLMEFDFVSNTARLTDAGRAILN